MDDHAIHLLYSANRWECRAELERLLSSGTTVIADRYTFSGVAYTTAKGIDADWCMAPEVGLIAPDIFIYLRLDAETALERGAAKPRERYETKPFLRRVADAYDNICVTASDDTWCVVDASQSLEDVEAAVLRAALVAISENDVIVT
jgi:dTMP kinase